MAASEKKPPAPQPRAPFGTLNESALHAALKRHYRRPGDQAEAMLDGFQIDLLRAAPEGAGGEPLLIEIQTGNFTALRRKLERLLPKRRVLAVLPVAREKWIVREDAEGRALSRRKSPLRGRMESAFDHLTSLAPLLCHANLQIEVALIQCEEIRRRTGARRWRRQGWGTHARRLLAVLETRRFARGKDWLALLPAGLPAAFTTAGLAAAGAMPQRLAQRMAYTLREAGLLATEGKQGRLKLYRRAAALEKSA